jgi:excisionase family DNA binding protein
MKRPSTLNPEQVAQVAGVTRRTVYAWITGGLLPGHKAGPKMWRVYSDVLTAYLARGAVAAKEVDDRLQARLMAFVDVTSLKAVQSNNVQAVAITGQVQPNTKPVKNKPKQAVRKR